MDSNHSAASANVNPESKSFCRINYFIRYAPADFFGDHCLVLVILIVAWQSLYKCLCTMFVFLLFASTAPTAELRGKFSSYFLFS